MKQTWLEPGRKYSDPPLKGYVLLKRLLIVTAAILLHGIPDARAQGGPYAPYALLTPHFFTGLDTGSLAGSLGYSLTIGVQARRGMLRPDFAADFQYSTGTAKLGADQPGYTLYGAAFLGGLKVVPINEGRVQPYLGAAGIVSWHLLKLSPPPTTEVENTDGLAFGYEISAGVDLRLWSRDGKALRIQSAIWSLSGELGGVSGFDMNGFRFSIGVVY